MLDLVTGKLHKHGHKAKLMVFPHYTWDKFEDLLAQIMVEEDA